MNAPHPLPVRLCRLAAADAAQLSDADALTRYAADRDAAAFEVLVWRHGPMVWGVVRRILRHDHDAEDAFQAAFLALAREAHRIDGVAGWLHRVAFHIALKMKSRPVRREAPAERGASHDAAEWREVGAILDAEINRLPERYREAFVLCCLEGKSNTEAGQELGCPTGTIDSRLNWARQRLRERLVRRGVTLAALTPGILAPELAHAAVETTATPRAELIPLAVAGVRAMNRISAKVIGGSILAASMLAGLAGWALSANTLPPPRPEVALVGPVVAPVPKEKPENLERSLLLVEQVPNGPDKIDTRRLVRIRFKAGVAGNPEVLYTDDQRLFTHRGGYRIHDDRYVVTEAGSVFDLKDKAWIHKEHNGDVLTIEGNRVIYRIDQFGANEGIFAYDLAKKSVEKIAKIGELPWIGTRSPDGKRTVYAGKRDKWELRVSLPDGKSESLGEGFAFDLSPASSRAVFVDDTPVLWLDNDRILTQTGNGRLVEVNVNRKTRSEVVNIPVNTDAWVIHPPALTRDGQGRIAYAIGREVYRVDAHEKTQKRTDWLPIGLGYEVMRTTPWVIRQVIRRNGTEIGEVKNGIEELTDFRPTDHYLAAIVTPNAQAPKNVPRLRVWSAATARWTTLDIQPSSLVGWVK